jgi:uncharacterized membrane protein YdjX (TVP38/TMEM64 family)
MSKNIMIKVFLLFVVAIAYIEIPEFQKLIYSGIDFLKHRDFHGLKIFLLSYGNWAPVISILLMVIQSLFPFIPGVIMTITNAWLFGWYLGTIYSCIGALLGAILDFIIARWYGKFIVYTLVEKRYTEKINKFIKKNGVIAVFITRLVPFIPFKMVSYSAGLSTMSIKPFVIVTGIGQVPAIAIYSIIGESILFDINKLILATVLLFLLAGIIYHFKEYFNGYILKFNK